MNAYLCLGSNVGNSVHHIRIAIIELNTHPSVNVLKTSSLYISKPVDATQQDDFYNVAVKIETSLNPTGLLQVCKTIEKLHQRKHFYHWGPRTLDIDILGYGNKHIVSPQLTIPHIEIANRDFFILPTLEIESELNLPELGKLKQLPSPPKNVINICYFDMMTT